MPRLLLINLLLFACCIAASAQEMKADGKPSLRTAALKINVNDMDKALSFYSGKLGFEVADRSDYPRQVVLKTDGSFKLILARVRRLQKVGATETQVGLTLQVNDLDQAIEKMKSLNVEFAETKPRKEGVGNAIFILDPFGMKISLMHQTIARVEPFEGPRIYNFGILIPDMGAAREFYTGKLGFVARSEKYLPLDLPLGHPDNTFGFMLHYRPGVTSIKSEYPQAAPFIIMVFEARDLSQTVRELKKNGVKIIASKSPGRGQTIVVEDPFGNVSEVVESRK
ncbi:MAG TPA: VOC family protein [Blastocatellia bacterium]|nr:VOC family protein [Blastocatellia bacterium]